MLDQLQVLSFEVGRSCNFSNQHPWCPSNDPSRYQDATTPPATNRHFINFLDFLKTKGFKGVLAFHYYNEPTLEVQRCKILIRLVHQRKMKTLIWTNGKVNSFLLKLSDHVFRTEYEKEGPGTPAPFLPDDRLRVYDTLPAVCGRPCYRPSTLEMIVNYFGDIRLCCVDWRGSVHIGNIQTDPHEDILQRWEAAAQEAWKGTLDVCRRCHQLEKSPILTAPDWKML